MTKSELEVSEPDNGFVSSLKFLILQVLQRLVKLLERKYELHQLSNFDAMNENPLQIQQIKPTEKSVFLVEYHSQKGDYLVHFE